MPVAAWGAVGPAEGRWSLSGEGFDPPALHHPNPATLHARAHAVAVLAGCWLSVGQPLAVRLPDEHPRTLAVADLPVFVSECELVAVARQMPTPDVVIHASDAAL